jgi:hypothetical protein
MSNIIIHFFEILFFITISYAQSNYTPQEANNHIGEKVIIVGIVDEVHTARTGATFLNRGGEYPDNTFTVVIFKSDSYKFPNVESYEKEN